MAPARALLLAGTLAGATAAGLALWWPAGDGPRPASAVPPAKAVQDRDLAAGTVSAAGTDGHRGAAAVLPSHRGTTVDGAVQVDDDGNVVPDHRLRRLFEYFLTGMGRASLEALRARLGEAIEQRGLPADAQAQVMALFDQYLRYRQALGDLPRPTQPGLRQALEARYALRRELFGAAVAEAMFGREEAIDRYALEKREIMTDEALSPEQRERRLAVIEQQLPAEVREARRQSRLALELRRRTQALREAGADEARIHALRQALVGAEAAQRLQALERRREQWQQRLAAYRRERRRIADSPGLAPEDKQAAIERLLAEHFEPHEVRRVRALERIGDDG